MTSRRHPISRRADTSDKHESAAILGSDIRGTLAILSDHGIEPVFYDNGQPHFLTRDVRRVADGRPIIRARRPMY